MVFIISSRPGKFSIWYACSFRLQRPILYPPLTKTSLCPQGISDAPAWIVSKANMYARQTGKTPFAVYQGAWNVVHRDIEREIVPMVKAEGMALCPFDVLSAGKIRTDAEEEKRRQTGETGLLLYSNYSAVN